MNLKQVILGCGIVLLTSTTIGVKADQHLGSDLPIIGDGAAAAKFDNLANDAADAGHMKEAITDYQKAIAVCPFDENATLGLARCAAHGGDFPAATTYYKNAIDGHKEDYNIDLLTEYNLALIQDGDAKEAISVYNHVVDLCQQGRTVTPMEIIPPKVRSDGLDYAPVQMQAMIHLIRALNTSISDDKTIAAEMTQAETLMPDSGIIYFYEGVLLNRVKKDGAKAAFQHALALDHGLDAQIIQKWIAASK